MTTRDQQENFAQDRQGNVNRELDTIRAQGGMELDDGLVEIQGGQSDTPLVAMEIPDDARSVSLSEVHIHNNSPGPGVYTILSATLDSGGSIVGTTERTVPVNVSSGSTRIFSYTGKEFNEDAIAVVGDTTGWVGLGVYVDRPEEIEPDSTITESP